MATKVREPKYQTIIHLPGLPGSFTFRKKGKLRLDQQVRNFCLFHQCKGCFEVKVHFPNAINPKKIKYDATSEGITVDTLADHPRHHYKLKVPYPDGLKLHIPPDPEAQFHFGKLSCKLAILKYDKNKVIAFHTKRRWKDRAPEKSLKEQIEEGETKLFQTGNEALIEGIERKKQILDRKLRKKRLKERLRKIEAKRPSMDSLNERIAQKAEGVRGRPKKKRKLNIGGLATGTEDHNEGVITMSKDAQYSLIDGLVDNIDNKIKERRKRDLEKDQDLREYEQMKMEKKERKVQRKEALRDKFQRRAEKKKAKKYSSYEPKIKKKTSEAQLKKVRFNTELAGDYEKSFAD